MITVADSDINSLQNILDKCEDDNDRVYFGSTNDFDQFVEIVQRLYREAFFPGGESRQL